MPMNGTDLGNAVVAALQTVDPSMTEDQVNQLKAAWQAMGTAIVTYITANAQVAVNVTSVGGVTTGSGTSGPGSGTGTIS